MAKTLKDQTVSALFWNFMDKGGQQIFQFVFIFVLARLLSPDEFGLIAVLTIFTTVANILQESGFSSALIRKSDVDETDYASIFYFNVSISVIIYILFFLFAPVIANFYHKPELLTLSRFLFMAFFFNALGVVQNVHLIREMNFRVNTQVSLIAVVVSGVIAIVMAYRGYGVWSLAAQQVIQAFLRSLLLWLFVRWYPKARFSFVRIRSMFSYSGKLLLNSLFNQIIANIYPLVIGKRFSFSDAGFYSQARKLNEIPQSVIASTLQGVAFPLLNKFDDLKRKKRIFRKIVRVVSFVCFPIAIFTIIAAEPIVLIVLQEKFRGVIPLLRILVVGGSVFPLLYILSSLLQSLGKSGLLLTIEFIRNVLSVLVILITINYGVNAVVMGASFVLILSFVICYYITGKCIDYTLTEVFKDIYPYIVIALISYVPVHFLSYIIDSMLLLVIFQSLIGTVIYLALLKVFGSKVMDDFLRIIRRRPFH